MEKSILQKLHEDEGARRIFQNVLRDLHQLSEPEYDPMQFPDSKLDYTKMGADMKSLVFESSLDALINVKRKLDFGRNDTKIGHWCTRDGEEAVKTMNGWPLYWLTFSLVTGLPIHATHPPAVQGIAMGYTELELSLWAAGKDDNTMQKGIRAWAVVHFPAWEIKSLKCVRR